MDHGWIMYELCTDYVWILYDLCTIYVWNMHGLCWLAQVHLNTNPGMNGLK